MTGYVIGRTRPFDCRWIARGKFCGDNPMTAGRYAVVTQRADFRPVRTEVAGNDREAFLNLHRKHILHSECEVCYLSEVWNLRTTQEAV